MTTINKANSKVGITVESGFGEFDRSLETASSNFNNDQKDFNLNCSKTSPGRSRYGRTIKPKSPKNDII
ncbi:unnamed protein product, partial [Heterotrigona itama]